MVCLISIGSIYILTVNMNYVLRGIYDLCILQYISGGY